jgi:hypothetical protein
MLIAFLEDDERRQQAMQALLASEYPTCQQVFFDNAPDFIFWLDDHLPEVTLLCLDHDLGPNRVRDGECFDPGCGRDVADFVANRAPSCPVLIHSTNSYAVPGMICVLDASGWTVDRVVPFSDLEWVRLVWMGAVNELLITPPSAPQR